MVQVLLIVFSRISIKAATKRLKALTDQVQENPDLRQRRLMRSPE